MKDWIKKPFEFGNDDLASKFEEQEIDGRIIVSPTIRSKESMDALGLLTIGKRATFLDAVQKLEGMLCIWKYEQKSC